MGFGLLQNLKHELNLKGLLSLNKQETIKPFTVNDVLGSKFVDLYPEQKKWIDFCYNNQNTNPNSISVKLVLASRDYGKTDTITIYSVINKLYQNPTLTFLIATRQEKRAKQIIYSIGLAMKNLGFKGEFNKESIRLNGNFSKQPNITIANNSTASLRGNHVDYLIGDDLVISSDERSEIERKNTIDFYTEALNVAKTIILLGQPVHEDDLYAVLESVSQNKEKQGEKGINLEIMRSFNGSIPELDKDLDSLRLISSERDIQKNYFGELIADGLYPFRDIKVEEFEFKGATRACIDPAFQGEDSIGVAIGIKTENDEYKILATKVDGNIYELGKDIIKLLEMFNVYECYIESNDNGGAVRYFRNLANKSGIKFLAFRETIDKKIRIKSRIGAVKNKIILHPQSDIKAITYWNTSVKHEDCIDAKASLINFLNGNKDKVKVSYGY